MVKPKENAQDEIQAYLNGQKKARLERAKRSRAFVESGVSRKDLAEALRGASPLDASMRNRKPMPGSTRPATRPAMNQG